MTNQGSTKVRLVRCPKCRQVLAELPEVPLYKCGGCGTVLQAKNRRPETHSSRFSSQETCSAAKSQPDELLEAGSSSQPFTSPREIETLSDKDNTRCNGNSLELREDTSNLSSSPEAPDEDEIPSSGELSLEAQVRSTPGAGEHMERHKKDQTEREESERVRQKGVAFVAKVQNLPEHEHLESVLPPQVHASVSQKEDYLQENKASSHIISRANESDISPSTGQIKESNTNTNGYRSNATSRSPSKESLVSFYLASSDNEIPTHFPRDERKFGRFSSLDTFGSSSPPMANYPINGTYYAYDSSESSYDGNYDQVREQILQHPRKNKDADISSIELLGKNGVRGRDTANGKQEWGHARNHHWSQPVESNNYTIGNRKRLDGQEGFSRLPFPSRASAVLGPGPESYHHHSSLLNRPVVKPQCPEPNKLDLLRTVCELQDQLSRMQLPEIGRYNNHFPLAREMYSGAPHHPHGYNVCPSQVDVCPGQWDPPHYRPPQAGCSCPHCLSGTQDCRYSSHLPPHSPPMRGSMCCAARPSISNSSSPLRPVTGEARACLKLKEKYFAGKRHVRPVTGGAPMVSCYDCMELLLLPADFLLFNRKKYHRLKCSACRTILRFSLHGGTHIVPYMPGPITPPPPVSKAADTRDGSRYHQAEPFRRAAEPVSCSDDYRDGRSNGKVSSGSSFEAVEDRKMKSVLTTRSMGKWKVGPTLEIEELPSSPLHRLMGYSSPSQVLDD
ncbi:Uncharacterized protein SHERM_02307 [Striga hermonthica]|uniref:Zinc-ribbon domain-containing protein n=1 Tax=Striga hermonthica TaxID=68872 RepID=A0A9N7NNX8_STRHE|nr:Uncharacterized protein SHERM_02307 [Striga hermonthica]